MVAASPPLSHKRSYKVSGPHPSSIVPLEPCFLSFFLPTLPMAMAALLAAPIPLLHLTGFLKPVPEKQICTDTSQHLTFDVSVFILAYCLPVLLIFFLSCGLILR